MSDAILSRSLGRIVRVVLVFAFVAVIGLGIAGTVAMAKAMLGGGALLVLLILLSVDPSSIKELVVKPTGISLRREVATAQAAAAGAPAEEQDESLQLPDATGDELTDLRLRLEAKLSYVAGRMNLDSGMVNIGSLREDGYLTDDEAKTADRVRTMSTNELSRAPKAEREAFLEAARELVGSIRAAVLAGAVRKELRRQGWNPGPAEGGKRDIRAERDGRTVRLAPLFVLGRESDLLPTVRRRLADTHDADRRIVVIPSNSAMPTSPSDDDPAVAKLDELEAALV
jgi:hypothetical protein